jgi:ribosome-binding protein aMBF1 (putative translation factor)
MTYEGNFVEAIENGKIVRVTEGYAKREGLFILRKQEPLNIVPQKKNKEEEGRPLFDDFRKPLRFKENDLAKDMIDNFHWILLEKRKVKGITRKQLANALGENENSIKLMENGVIPSGNYVLVNKLEKFYGISLRKGAVNYQESARKLVENKKNTEGYSEEIRAVSGDEIDLEE